MYKLLLCLRYLRTKYIALACIISVMLGVATMIVVNSVMAGFSNEMRERLHNFIADIVVESRTPIHGMGDSKEKMAIVERAAGKYIAAMTPTVEILGMITFTDPYTGESYPSPVQIHGIDPAGKALIGPLADYLDSYNPVKEDNRIIREPLRDRNEPLSWELTSEAAEYRRRNKELQNHRLQNTETEAISEPAGEPTEPVFDQTGSADSSNSKVPPAGSPDDKKTGGETSDEETQPASAGESGAESAVASAIPENPFDVPSTADSTKVNTGPAPARIYLAEGIVSFQAENPETGRLQKIMMVNPGDDVLLSTVTAASPPEPVRFNATVVDIFRSGMNDLDTSIVLMNLKELQKNRGMLAAGKDSVTAIHIRLKDYATAPEVVKLLKAAFPPGTVHVKTWEEKQGLLLEAVEVETAILNVLLFLIIAVAGFGILAIFFMIVVEKTRDIGILKSLGASSSGVMSIFLSYGLALGLVGSVAGVIIGLVFVRYINEIEDMLSWLTGRKVFDEKIYYFHSIPTHVSTMMVVMVALGAISIAVLASVLPARRASRLHPVRALRYE